jgi:hypothetical protein
MKLRFLVVSMVCAAIVGQPARPQQAAKPMTKDQIMSVVTAGIDNAELAKKIEERGIDFDLTEDYLQALRRAGAQEVVIKALRTVRPSPMGHDQLLLLVAGGVPSERAAALVKQRGVDFMPDDKFLESLRTAGADEALIAVVREAKPLEVQRHLTRDSRGKPHPMLGCVLKANSSPDRRPLSLHGFTQARKWPMPRAICFVPHPRICEHTFLRTIG